MELGSHSVDPSRGHSDEGGEAGGVTSKYLTFFLDAEEYGLEILKVQEIIGLLPITRVPRSEAHLRGVINLRGRVVPIVDLRLVFGLSATLPTDETCIIIVEVAGTLVGVLVDRVSEVVDIAEGEVEDPPRLGHDLPTEYLLGIAKTGGRVRLLLDIDRTLSSADAGDLSVSGAEDHQLEALPI